MSFDTFVKIDGIEGDSTDSKHSGWIEATGYKAGASQKVSSTVSSAGGATTGRVDVKPFTFTKQVDGSSPKLYQACCAGTHFNKIVIAIHRAGGTEKVKFMELGMTLRPEHLECFERKIATHSLKVIILFKEHKEAEKCLKVGY